MFTLPDGTDHTGDLALLCEARVGDSVTELRQPISRVTETV